MCKRTGTLAPREKREQLGETQRWAFLEVCLAKDFLSARIAIVRQLTRIRNLYRRIFPEHTSLRFRRASSVRVIMDCVQFRRIPEIKVTLETAGQIISASGTADSSAQSVPFSGSIGQAAVSCHPHNLKNLHDRLKMVSASHF